MAVNNITNFATQAQTEEEKLRKQNTQLPYLQGTNQTQPVTLTPNAGQTQLQPMSQQVPQSPALQTADQVSTQQATQPSAMQQMINQKAQSLMQNPTQGFDQQAYKQGQLSSYDLQNAKMYEALRQKNAGIANSGIWQSESLQNQVDALRNRGELERKIDYENRDFNIESAINAMTAGLKAEGQSQSTVDNAVKNLISTYSAQTPERTALMGSQSAKELQLLEGDQALQQMIAKQDWEGIQRDLDRKAETALQSGDIAGQKEIEALRGQIQLEQQKAQQVWQTTERASSQIYNTTERIDQNSANLAMKKFELEGQKALQMQEFANSLSMMNKEFSQEEYMAKLQSNLEEARAGKDYGRTEALTKLQSALQAGLQDDAQTAAKELAELETTTQKFLQQKNAELQLKMQTNGFSQEERNKELDFMYQDAKASNDVDRQKKILKYQQKMNAMDMAEKYGYDSSLAYINEDIQKALQDNDFENAEALQNARIKVEVEKLAQEKTFEQARIDLQTRGVDMAEVEQQYTQIQSLVEQNILPESALMDYATKTLKANGVDTSSYKMVDKQDAAEQALQQEYELQKKQFVQTHPEYLVKTYVDAGGNKYTVNDLKKLNPAYTEAWADANMIETDKVVSSEGQKAMNEYINNALYGEETEAQKNAKANAGYLNESDLGTAAPGDKFNLTKPTSYGGQTLPAGKYTVRENKFTSGNTFFGTARDTTETFLVDQATGKEYNIGKVTGKDYGNIISNLWA